MTITKQTITPNGTHTDCKPFARGARTAATIGFFDGVHTGHQYLIEQVKSFGQPTVAITFDRHPRAILNENGEYKYLTTLNERLNRLAQIGVDEALVLTFNKDLASMTAYQFMKEVVRERCNADTLIIGHDHLFGHNRSETITDYIRYGKSLGITVHQAKPTENAVSSSIIRQLLLNGDITTANALLGYHYTISGIVVEGQKIGRTIGFPTANIQPPTDKLIPQEGVYIGQCVYSEQTYKAMIGISRRPTVTGGNVPITIEANLLDFAGDLYGQTLNIEFTARLRDNQKFDNLDQLKAALHRDALAARAHP